MSLVGSLSCPHALHKEAIVRGDGSFVTFDGVLSKEHSNEGTLCLEIMRLKIKVTNEKLRSMFLSHDQSQGAIPRIRL